MNKVFENYRDHPALKYGDYKLVFKITDKVYLIQGLTIKQIIPTSITTTNIGDPYKNLCRLYFIFIDSTDNYEESIDFDYELKEDLRLLFLTGVKHEN